MSWTIDSHKYLSDVVRTALKIIIKRNIKMTSSDADIAAAGEEMVALGVYDNAGNKIRQSLFTLLKNFGLVDFSDNVTPVGIAFASGLLSVRETAFILLLNRSDNFEGKWYFHLRLIARFAIVAIKYDSRKQYLTQSDFAALTLVHDVSDITLSWVEKQVKSPTTVSFTRFDVWCNILSTAGLMKKERMDGEVRLYINNWDLIKWLDVNYSDSLAMKGSLESATLDKIILGDALMKGAFSDDDCKLLIRERTMVLFMLFCKVDYEIASKYLLTIDSSTDTVAKIAALLGLSDGAMAPLSCFKGLESLVGINFSLKTTLPKVKFIGDLIVKNIENLNVDRLLNIDRFSVALKLFAEKRKNDGEGGWFKIGRSVNGRIREYFDAFSVDVLKGFDAEKIKELFCGMKELDGNKFQLMWSGKPNGGWSHIKPESESETKEIVDFLVELKEDASISSKFLQTGFVRPNGFGHSVISELLMKFHPDSCIKHGSRSHDALSWLGMIDFAWNSSYSALEYAQICGAAAKILAKMKELKMPRQIFADGSEDTTSPDYLTVNEFIYFVNTNKDSIKEKVMSKVFKSAQKKAKTGTRKLSAAVENDEMMQRLMAALRTKPFAILAGHSGTGKSQLVRRLAYMTCNDEKLLEEAENSNAPGNYCMIQVKPNWHDSTDLLGYYTEMNGGKYRTTKFVEFICKAYAYPETPFFVCLDEMNLAPVEQYFAEFLSAIESYSEKTGITDRLITEKAEPDEICGGTKLSESLAKVKERGLTIPRNLFVVGTVNVDETTCQFSRKVLDRAMTILMTAVSFESMTEANDPSKEECFDPEGIGFFLNRPTQTALVKGQVDKLDAIQKIVGDSPFAIAYRFANEYALYQSAYQILKREGLGTDGETPDPNNDDSQKIALDHVVMMKLLPRIHGERGTVKVLFEGDTRGDKEIPGLKSLLPPDGISVKMMDNILLRHDEYLTFWP